MLISTSTPKKTEFEITSAIQHFRTHRHWVKWVTENWWKTNVKNQTQKLFANRVKLHMKKTVCYRTCCLHLLSQRPKHCGKKKLFSYYICNPKKFKAEPLPESDILMIPWANMKCIPNLNFQDISKVWKNSQGKKHMSFILWLVVSTYLKNISQNGNLPQTGLKIQNVWNHHLVIFSVS